MTVLLTIHGLTYWLPSPYVTHAYTITICGNIHKYKVQNIKIMLKYLQVISLHVTLAEKETSSVETLQSPCGSKYTL
jgi:hypothetical protein